MKLLEIFTGCERLEMPNDFRLKVLHFACLKPRLKREGLRVFDKLNSRLLYKKKRAKLFERLGIHYGISTDKTVEYLV